MTQFSMNQRKNSRIEGMPFALRVFLDRECLLVGGVGGAFRGFSFLRSKSAAKPSVSEWNFRFNFRGFLAPNEPTEPPQRFSNISSTSTSIIIF